jgi:hypothetical protein
MMAAGFPRPLSVPPEFRRVTLNNPLINTRAVSHRVWLLVRARIDCHEGGI